MGWMKILLRQHHGSQLSKQIKRGKHFKLRDVKPMKRFGCDSTSWFRKTKSFVKVDLAVRKSSENSSHECCAGLHEPHNRGGGNNNDNNNNNCASVPLQRCQAEAQTESDVVLLPRNLQVETGTESALIFWPWDFHGESFKGMPESIN